MTAWYNEVDDYAADWLERLIAGGHIADGVVDRRDVRHVEARDLERYTQCHFFAGIGGWSYALRLAGWGDDRPVWTGSCPCQPFSGAGKGAAADDERHLWPAWFSLIAQRRPAIVLGEQVEAAIGWGWLDVVQADLEAAGYACGATVLPACGVGAFHIRDRIWFVGDAGIARLEGHAGNGGAARRRTLAPRSPAAPGALGFWSDAEWLDCIDGKARPVEPGTFPLAHGISARVGRLRAYGNAIVPQLAAAFIRSVM